MGAFDRTLELALTSIVFGLVGVFSPTRTGMTVLLLASRVRPWARTVAYAAGSTAIFGLVILLGLLGVEATSLNMQVPVTIALGFTHLVFHAPGPDQRRFLDLYADQVLPRLRARYR